VISKKAIIAGIFSAIVGVGMLAMPVRAMAHEWNHDGDGTRHEHHDNGRHSGWFNHGGGNNGWFDHHADGDRYSQSQRPYYPTPAYGYGYGNHPQPYVNNYGYGYGNGYGYGRQAVPRNGEGMIDPRDPNLIWSCDSQGHHCHWAPRYGSNYGNGNGYYGNNGYGNSYYGNNGYSPLAGLGSLFGAPRNGAYSGYGNGPTYGSNGSVYGNNGYYGGNGYGSSSPLGGLGSLLGPMFNGQRP
jgi:hypothetical protein